MTCVHCCKRTPCRAGGLCTPCYNHPVVRSIYVGRTPEDHRGYGLGNMEGTIPTPTDALPGTEEKMRVLEERARLGQRLWHPNDARSG
jgi:hypothetical protein